MLTSGRARYFYQWWDRDRSGEHTEHNTPRGKRTPNGAVLGHSIDNLFMNQQLRVSSFVGQGA